MAFRTKSHRFVAGSLNVAAPSDKIPAGDAIALSNWRVDAMGMLRSRLTEQQLIDKAFYLPIRSLWMYEAPGYPWRYVGDGLNLWETIGGPSYPPVAIAPNPGGLPIGFANYQGYAWCLNAALQGRANGTGVLKSWVPLPPVAPCVVTAVAPTYGGITGSYSYWVSFWTVDQYGNPEFESNLGPQANIVDAAQANNLSNIPISPDPSVHGRYIYRSGGTEDQVYQVRILYDNVATTSNDEEMTDLQVVEEGITHTLDHDPPPPGAADLCGPYFDHLIAWNAPGYVNRIWWTKQMEPGYWPGANPQIDEGNWADVGDDGEPIIRCVQHPNFLMIYKERSVWRLLGDPDSLYSIISRLSGNVGLVGARAITTIGANDYFQGPVGIYVSNGDAVNLVSDQKLDPMFRGDLFQYSAAQAPIAGLNLTPAIRALSSMAERDGRLWFSYADANNSLPNTSLTFDPLSGRWAVDSRAFTALYDEGPSYDFVGAIGFSVFNISANLGGIPVALNYASMYDDLGTPRVNKVWNDVEIDSLLQPGDSLTVTASFDFGAAVIKLGTLVAGVRNQIFPINGADGQSAKNLSIQLAGSVLNQAQVYEFHVQYRIEQRDAVSFDSGPFQPCGGSYAQVIEFELEYQSTGTVAWLLYSDVSGALEPVAGGSFASAGGLRTTLEVSTNGQQEGRTFRLLLGSATTFQVLALRFYVRRIGVYLVPTALFTSRPQDFGTKRIKIFRKLEIRAEIDVSMLVAVYADSIPDVLSLTLFLAVGTVPIDGFQEVYLPANTRSRLFRVDVSSSGGGNSRLYSIRVWYKALGEAQGTPWSWADIPVEPSEELFRWIDLPVDSAE